MIVKDSNPKCGGSCCSDGDNDSLILSGSCFINSNNNCEGICLGDFNITPITDHSCNKKTLNELGKFVVSPSNIKVLYVLDNLNLWYRKINNYCNNLTTINYKLELSVTSSNIDNTKPSLILLAKLVPYSDQIIATWNNVGDLQIGSYQFNSWNSIDVSWNDLREFRLNNIMCFPELEKEFSLDMYLDTNSGISSNASQIIMEFSDFKYEINLYYSFNNNNDQFSITIGSIAIKNRFYSSEISTTLENHNFTVNQSSLDSLSEFYLFTQAAVEYLSFKPLLVLTETEKESQYEIFNQDKTPKTFEISQWNS